MSASMTTWRQVDIRRMALVRIEKARTRTLKMTVVIGKLLATYHMKL